MANKNKQIWTAIIDFEGGTYIQQFELGSLSELQVAISEIKEEPFCLFNDFNDASDWVPISGVRSVYCNGGLTKDDLSYLIHAVLTKIQD